MFCDQCGALNREQAKFCIKCGIRLNNDTQVLPSQQPTSHLTQNLQISETIRTTNNASPETNKVYQTPCIVCNIEDITPKAVEYPYSKYLMNNVMYFVFFAIVALLFGILKETIKGASVLIINLLVAIGVISLFDAYSSNYKKLKDSNTLTDILKNMALCSKPNWSSRQKFLISKNCISIEIYNKVMDKKAFLAGLVNYDKPQEFKNHEAKEEFVNILNNRAKTLLDWGFHFEIANKEQEEFAYNNSIGSKELGDTGLKLVLIMNER